MKYKDDWPAARERLCALWEGRNKSRPCLSIRAPRREQVKTGPPPPTTPEQKWLDPEWVLQDMEASLANHHWVGEAIPSYLLMAGWAVCYGSRVEFNLNTIWLEPGEVDFDNPPAFELDWENPYIERYVALYQAAVEFAGKDDFLVGKPCLLPASDLLPAFMGPELFLTALLDHREWIHAALDQIARCQVEGYKRFRQMAQRTHDFWYGNPGWMPMWGPEPYHSTQSDVSCMLSPASFEEFVEPELALYSRELGPMWYHLDGGDAQQHLPCLLSRPYMRIIQYVATPNEPPNGPGQLDLYRRIQAAGKIVHVTVQKEDVEPLARELDPALLCLQTHCASLEEAEQLLADAERWTAG